MTEIYIHIVARMADLQEFEDEAWETTLNTLTELEDDRHHLESERQQNQKLLGQEEQRLRQLQQERDQLQQQVVAKQQELKAQQEKVQRDTERLSTMRMHTAVERSRNSKSKRRQLEQLSQHQLRIAHSEVLERRSLAQLERLQELLRESMGRRVGLSLELDTLDALLPDADDYHGMAAAQNQSDLAAAAATTLSSSTGAFPYNP